MFEANNYYEKKLIYFTFSPPPNLVGMESGKPSFLSNSTPETEKNPACICKQAVFNSHTQA